MTKHNIGVHVGLEGYYKLVIHKGDANGNPIPGTERVAADWFPNLITDNGKNLLTTTVAYTDFVQVGTGNTPPAVTNTALVNRVAATNANAVGPPVFGAQGSAPYFGFWRKTYRFGIGAAAGNLAELGVGPVSTGNLFSRALIVDGLGVPTVITVLADEILDVIYELRNYPTLTDVNSVVNIEGVNRNVVLRPAIVSTGLQGSVGGWQPGNNPSCRPNLEAGSHNFTVYGGVATLGSITSTPTVGPGGNLISYATSQATSRTSIAAYIPGSFYRDYTITLGLNDGNVTGGGIGALLTGWDTNIWQLSFSPLLNKTNTKILTFTMRVSWDRHTP
jgi:hypothetical protein